MTNKIIAALRAIVLLSTIVLSTIAILYVCDLFSSDYLRRLVIKFMSIVGIITGASLVIILVTNTEKK